ncbi:MAG: CPBP family intramembrane glutamic endopeptidase [Terracidiphilus sp.]
MTNIPEDELREPLVAPANESNEGRAAAPFDLAEQPSDAHMPLAESIAASAPQPSAVTELPPSIPERPLFQSYMEPTVRRPVRIPHFGHLMLLLLLILVALSILALALGLASHFHLFGWHLSAKAATDVGLNLISEIVLYFTTFGFGLIAFPLLWNEGYFQGLQWRADAVRSRFRMLEATAFTCFGLAILDQILMPGPANAPIEKMIRSPGAAWMMFAFGISLAPFFEEMLFRGFLLPALCTACDWAAESIKGTPPRSLDASGHPRWSLPAMIIGSIATSIPFALLHIAQQGHSLGPFLLLIVISLILCAVRLMTRSLAASTLVHASYNFLIFFVELIATGGFRHFNKM